MSALLAFFLSNPTVLAVMGGILGALGWGLHQRRAGATAERNAQKAKEADAYAKHIEDVANAGNARPSGGVSDDPYNRDNR